MDERRQLEEGQHPNAPHGPALPAPPHQLSVVPGGGGRVELPQNLEAEESVIGCILNFGAPALRQVAELLEERDFYHPACACIYGGALEVLGLQKPIDLITVGEQLRATGAMRKLTALGADHLAKLANSVATMEHLAHHARIVREKAVARQIIMSAHNLTNRARGAADVDALASAFLEEAQEIKRRVPTTGRRFFDAEAWKKRVRAELGRPIPPKIPFGIPDLDEAMGGGAPAGGVVGVGAPPKHQKTAFLIDLIVKWRRLGERVLYITGENSGAEIFARLSAHEQFGKGGSNKFHGRIKHEDKFAEENGAPIDWLGEGVDVVSLPDEEMRDDGQGLSWLDAIAACERLPNPPTIILDYVEEIADRLRAKNPLMTAQDANKAVMTRLKFYASRTRSRAIAVLSVGRGSYNGMESVFKNPNASPEEFASVAKHSGYIEYAASALLALQFAEGGEIEDADGHPCVPMKIHLAFAREGKGPTTANVLAYGGYCTFRPDERERDRAEEDLKLPTGVKGDLIRELLKADYAGGATCATLARLVGKRTAVVQSTLKELVKEGEVDEEKTARAILYRHRKWAVQGSLH